MEQRSQRRDCSVGLVASIPIASMYGVFTYIWLICMVNVGKHTIHGCYGIEIYILITDPFSLDEMNMPIGCVKNYTRHGS